MKVKIRKYPDWFGPYQLVEKLCFWAKKEKDEYGFPYTPDWVHDLGEKYSETWLGELHVKVAQKVIDWQNKRQYNIKIDRYDTWSMDSTLAHIVLPMLKQLKETKHGAPFVELEDRPAHLIPPLPQNPYDTDPYHFEAWDWVMDEMIFAFETKAGKYIDWEDQFHSGEIDRINVPQDKDGNDLGPGFKFGEKEDLDPEIKEKVKWYEWRKGPNDTSHFDKDGHMAYQERITRGFTLFGKYFEGLWD